MDKTLKLLNLGFESSSVVTPEFKTFVKVFKKELNAELKSVGAVNIKYIIGHFYVSGFFTINDKITYFSLSDVRNRGLKSIMYRSAKSYSDYVGGSNMYVDIYKGFAKNMV